MKLLFLTIIVFNVYNLTADVLTFGVISPVNPQIVKQQVTPLMQKISEITKQDVVFKTGYDYADTIKKFADGTFDIGLIGPAPYVKAQKINPDALEILAGIKNSDLSPFRSVIISKKGSQFLHYKDLKNQKFAFGSPNSTLSFFVYFILIHPLPHPNNLIQNPLRSRPPPQKPGHSSLQTYPSKYPEKTSRTNPSKSPRCPSTMATMISIFKF